MVIEIGYNSQKKWNKKSIHQENFTWKYHKQWYGRYKKKYMKYKIYIIFINN